MNTQVTGTAHIVAAPASIAPAAPPHTYLGMARLLLQGVRPLCAPTPPCTIPLAFLAAQVDECDLKGSLSRSGDDRRLKDKGLRHNLEALWELAHSEGLAVNAVPPSWVQRLSHLHNTPYFLRYSTGVHGLVTPGPEPMCTDLEELVAVVERQVLS